MPFIPHTEDDIREMLAAVGVERIEQLFDEIPPGLRCGALSDVPAGMSEMEVTRLMTHAAARDGNPLNFIGAGAYEHHIPAAVWQLATRGEFYTSYTPYQAEASQGTLQLTYEYQSMMAALTGMEVANASLYDGASALAEAVLMAMRVSRKPRAYPKRVLLPDSVHPAYRATTRSIVRQHGVELLELPYDKSSGRIEPAALRAYADAQVTALVIPQPNFFGVLEEVDELTAWAEAHGVLTIAVVNPVSLALVKPPGEWGGQGADIVVGEGQPLGAPLSSGGPYCGFMCCKRAYVRHMPGRIVGRTVDADGNPGFVLTLQAREQHIRRSKATSNICTNQGLLVTAATIHLALLGPEGLARVASSCYANTHALTDALRRIEGVEPAFDGDYFHEAVLRLPRPAPEVLDALAAQNILGGYALGGDYPELGGCVLVCATETKDARDIERYAQALAQVLQ
ncbi:MAG: aminomethyl-transferring glycine dehydrogenase subunit GcvPA [Gammaproteobacteria bacterium]